MAGLAYVRTSASPALAQPRQRRSAAQWIRANLFASPLSSAATLLLLAFCLWTLPPLIEWAFVRAIWSAPDGALCRANQDGACWAFIADKLDYLRYGSYPASE